MLGRTRSACDEGDAVTRPVMLKVATYNKPGQHMKKRAYANADDGYGTGRDLVTKPGQGLRTALELAANQKIDVYVSVETRTRQEKWEAVKGAWNTAGYDADSTCGAIKEGATSGHTVVGGVTVAWRKETVRRRQGSHTTVIVPTQVVQMELETDTATTVSVYGVYMPTGGAAKDEIIAAWNALCNAVLAGTHEHIWVIGDMNAVTQAWHNSGMGSSQANRTGYRKAC